MNFLRLPLPLHLLLVILFSFLHLFLDSLVLASNNTKPVQNLTVIDGEYDLDSSYEFIPGQTVLCTDELWLNSSANGQNSSLLTYNAIVFEDGDDPCTQGVFRLQEAVGQYNQTFEVEGIGYINVLIQEGIFGRLIKDDGDLICGPRSLGRNNSYFGFLKSGTLTYSYFDREPKVIGIEKSTVLFISEDYYRDNVGTLPQACGYTYDDALPDGSVCFPASATVQMQDGRFHKMDAVQVGNRVRVDKGASFSDVYTFGHRDQHTYFKFLRLESAQCQHKYIVLSPSHLLYVQGYSDPIPASDVVVGVHSLLLASDTTNADALDEFQPCLVSAKRIVREKGLYAPHTLDGNIIVNGFKASTFTTAVKPHVAKMLLAPVKAFYICFGRDLLQGLLHHGVPSYLSPVYNMLQNWLKLK